MSLRNHAEPIMAAALAAAMPDTAVAKALAEADFGTGRLVLIAAGKAGWQMAKAAYGQRRPMTSWAAASAAAWW